MLAELVRDQSLQLVRHSDLQLVREGVGGLGAETIKIDSVVSPDIHSFAVRPSGLID